MSNDFYASPQGAMAMHGAGRNLGRSEGWRDGYDEGIAEGVALGRRQAQEAVQPQIDQAGRKLIVHRERRIDNQQAVRRERARR